MPRYGRALKGWRSLVQKRTRRALPWCFWCGIMTELVRASQTPMGAFVLMCLSSYARPSEAYKLLRRHLVAPVKNVTQSWSIIIASAEMRDPTKTGLMDVSVMLDSSWTQWATPMWETLAAGKGHQRLWSFAYLDFTKALEEACDLLKMQAGTYHMRL